MSWTLPTAVVGVTAVLVAVQPALTAPLSSAEVNQQARSVTVRITSAQGAGSGVLIRQEGSTYTLLTARHVLSDKIPYEVITPDAQRYALDRNSIKTHREADLAIAEFRSTKSYAIAKMGDPATLTEGAVVYVAGFPARTAAMTDSIYNFTKGELTAAPTRPFQDGYGLVYTNTTLPGMSGGPIFNADGALIGIHGRADAKVERQDQYLNPQIYIKSGVNLGIPIQAVLSLIPQEKLAFARPSVPSATRSPEDQALINDLLAQSNFRLRQRDLPGAIAAMDQVIRLDPNNLNAYNERGSLYLLQRDFLAAVTDFRQTVQLDPNFAEGYYNQGIAYTRSGNPEQALASFKKAAELFKSQKKAEMYQRTLDQLKGFSR